MALCYWQLSPTVHVDKYSLHSRFRLLRPDSITANGAEIGSHKASPQNFSRNIIMTAIRVSLLPCPLSTPLDTIDNNDLLHRLEHVSMIRGTALGWFKSVG